MVETSGTVGAAHTIFIKSHLLPDWADGMEEYLAPDQFQAPAQTDWSAKPLAPFDWLDYSVGARNGSTS
jgi:hypothetical protein